MVCNTYKVNTNVLKLLTSNPPHLDLLPLVCILDWYFTVLHTCWNTLSDDSADSADAGSLNVTSLINLVGLKYLGLR